MISKPSISYAHSWQFYGGLNKFLINRHSLNCETNEHIKFKFINMVPSSKTHDIHLTYMCLCSAIRLIWNIIKMKISALNYFFFTKIKGRKFQPKKILHLLCTRIKFNVLIILRVSSNYEDVIWHSCSIDRKIQIHLKLHRSWF